MPLTDPSQASLGNTLKVDDHELTIVDLIVSGNGNLVVLKSADSPLCLLAHPGDLIDGENVDYVKGPAAPGQGIEAASREAAQDAEIANLRAKVEFLSQQNAAPPVQDTPVPQEAPPEVPQAETPGPASTPPPATDATDATVPGVQQPDPGNTTTVQEN